MILSVSDLAVEADGKTLFDQFNLTVESGALVTVRGSNGSGKSTLLRFLAGLKHINEGSVKYHGFSFAYVGQKHGLNLRLTVQENLTWFSKLDVAASLEDLDEILDQFALTLHLNRLAGTLSTGQQRRCVLARLCLAKHDLWLLDEPLNGVDSSGFEQFETVLKSHLQGGGAAVVATHDDLDVAATDTIDLDTL